MPTFIDLSGKRFGQLVVIRRVAHDKPQTLWLCECDCGKSTKVLMNSLRRGLTKSCGCLRRQPPANKHGHVGTKVYSTWAGMMSRCNNPRNNNYPNWGGRGIKVCDRWRLFLNFLEDMGQPPTSSHTIERKDNDRDYEPSNCRWATRTEQGNNKRNNRRYHYKGRLQTCGEIARDVGMDYYTLRQRLYRYGWSLHDAITKPVSSSHLIRG